MSTNRVLLYLHHDPETAGYVRANRRRRWAMELTDRLEAAATIDGFSIIETHVAPVESFADGDGRISWFFPTPETDHRLRCDERTDFRELATAVVASIRGYVTALVAAADALERVES